MESECITVLFEFPNDIPNRCEMNIQNTLYLSVRVAMRTTQVNNINAFHHLHQLLFVVFQGHEVLLVRPTASHVVV